MERESIKESIVERESIKESIVIGPFFNILRLIKPIQST